MENALLLPAQYHISHPLCISKQIQGNIICDLPPSHASSCFANILLPLHCSWVNILEPFPKCVVAMSSPVGLHQFKMVAYYHLLKGWEMLTSLTPVSWKMTQLGINAHWKFPEEVENGRNILIEKQNPNYCLHLRLCCFAQILLYSSKEGTVEKALNPERVDAALQQYEHSWRKTILLLQTVSVFPIPMNIKFIKRNVKFKNRQQKSQGSQHTLFHCANVIYLTERVKFLLHW